MLVYLLCLLQSDVLVNRLGDDNFKVREKAQIQLEKMGYLSFKKCMFMMFYMKVEIEKN